MADQRGDLVTGSESMPKAPFSARFYLAEMAAWKRRAAAAEADADRLATALRAVLEATKDLRDMDLALEEVPDLDDALTDHDEAVTARG